MVIEGLKYITQGKLGANVLHGLRYLEEHIRSKRVIDPANTNNCISDDLSALEKIAVVRQAGTSASKNYWGKHHMVTNIPRNQRNRLREIYDGLQQKLNADLSTSRSVAEHPVSTGSGIEANWLEMLKRHLPYRYQAKSAFVVDSNGTQSQQIDVVIYDRQYTAELYNGSNQRIIPAESVYAVLEVKSTLNRENLVYAGKKAGSVRRLERTSTQIVHAGNELAPRSVTPIIAGVLATNTSWKPPFGSPFEKCIRERDVDETLDLGCVLESGGFEIDYGANSAPKVQVSSAAHSLAYFFLRLLHNLQKIGTVAAVDHDRYLCSLEIALKEPDA